MPLSVQFRWSSPNVQVSSAPQESMERGLQGLASGIGRAVQKTYEKGLQERRNRIEDEDRSRRNRIEDEDRSRRMSEEDRKKKVYGEAAKLMRRRKQQLSNLKERRKNIVAEIEQLRTEIGMNG